VVAVEKGSMADEKKIKAGDFIAVSMINIAIDAFLQVDQ
jgi:hypothetical protein